jgi:hypothetical protein
MGELLQIVFQKGVDQSIDPRVAPTEIHAVAENVRWRKDGRPAKRYGSSSVDTSTLGALYLAQPVNAIATWNQIPVFAVGSAVRSQSALGWLEQPLGNRELSHFGPGEHDAVSRSEASLLANPTIGFHVTAARTILLYAWQTGITNSAYLVRDLAGSIIRPATSFGIGLGGSEPRCISTTNFIYLLKKNGTALLLDTFDPVTCTFIGSMTVGTLSATTDHYDGWGRGADFLVSYQSAAGVVTTKLFSAIAVPALLQTIGMAVGAAGARIAVMGDAASNVFVATVEPSIGQVKVQVFNNALTASLGIVVVEADINNDAQPGLVLKSATVADLVWGGFVPAPTEATYMRVCELSAAGVAGIIRTYFGVAPCSKPFTGPSYPANTLDAIYVWVETANSSTKWDSQRGYLLVQIKQILGGVDPLSPQLAVPGMPSAPTARFQLSDVAALGVGGGFVSPFLNAIRYGNGLSALYGVDSISVRSIFESMRMAARDTATAGRALQLSGGTLYEFVGELSQTGFASYPVIQSLTTSGAGGLSAGQYVYRVVFEYSDDQGRRHRSSPSDPAIYVAGAAGNAVSVVIKPLVADAHFWQDSAGGPTFTGRVVAHVYRSLANQGTLRRVTPNVGAPLASVPGTATISFLDTMPDSVAGAQEFLYTEGGVVPNTNPPPCQFMTVVAGRLGLGGQLDRTVVTVSKLLVEGEPSQFSDEAEFSIFLPEKCTGLASIDGTIVAFARERIYLISGDGPNDQGIGEFRPPVELPTDVGCIDWRSVLETSIGIFFQSKRGIYLLPRGFGTPSFIGAPIESTLAQFPIVVSATVVSQPSNSAGAAAEAVLGEISARFVLGSTEGNAATAIATFDLRTGGWSVDRRQNAPDQFGPAGTWLDRFVYSTTSGGAGVFRALRAESAGTYDDGPDAVGAGSFITSRLGTADVRPFGVGGYGGFDRVVAVGEYRGNAIVNISVSVDGAAPDVFAFTVTAADNPDGSVYLDVTPKTRIGTAIRVTVADADAAFPNPTEGFLLQALFVEHDTIGKTKRLAQARKA